MSTRGDHVKRALIGFVTVAVGTWFWFDGWERFDIFRVRRANYDAPMARMFLRRHARSEHVPEVIRFALKEGSTPRINELAEIWKAVQGKPSAEQIPSIVWEKVQEKAFLNAQWTFATKFAGSDEAETATSLIAERLQSCDSEMARETFLTWHLHRDEERSLGMWEALQGCLVQQVSGGHLKKREEWLEFLAQRGDSPELRAAAARSLLRITGNDP